MENGFSFLFPDNLPIVTTWQAIIDWFALFHWIQFVRSPELDGSIIIFVNCIMISIRAFWLTGDCCDAARLFVSLPTLCTELPICKGGPSKHFDPMYPYMVASFWQQNRLE